MINKEVLQAKLAEQLKDMDLLEEYLGIENWVESVFDTSMNIFKTRVGKQGPFLKASKIAIEQEKYLAKRESSRGNITYVIGKPYEISIGSYKKPAVLIEDALSFNVRTVGGSKVYIEDLNKSVESSMYAPSSNADEYAFMMDKQGIWLDFTKTIGERKIESDKRQFKTILQYLRRKIDL
ncbi:MAG: hypothetical protein KJ906_02505 [Nanoarchaeota archaeon]|nr:hypothetical protein [Nanoarchaeota archaeon]